MINAGTIAAYLTLSTTDFNKGIGDAIGQLGGLQAFSLLGSSAISALQGTMLNVTAGGIASFIGGMGSARSGTLNLLTAVSGLAGGLLAAHPGVSSASGSIATGIMLPLNSVSGSARSAMVNAGDGMISGLTARRDGILATARGIAESVASVIRAALKIQSPSQVMREIGGYAGQGLEMGLADMQGAVGVQASALADTVASAAVSVRASAQPGTAAIQAAALTGNIASSVTGARAFAQQGTSDGGMSSLTNRIDALCSLLERSDSIMQVDGRTFGRLIREYS